MKQPKKTNTKNVPTAQHPARRQFTYKPVCHNCGEFENADRTTKAPALALIDRHRFLFEPHECYAERVAKTNAKAAPGLELNLDEDILFRPFCNSCDEFHDANFIDETTARGQLTAHRKKFKFHICGIEREM